MDGVLHTAVSTAYLRHNINFVSLLPIHVHVLLYVVYGLHMHVHVHAAVVYKEPTDYTVLPKVTDTAALQ